MHCHKRYYVHNEQVNELSVENISFLVELWQFKYCKDIINISINQETVNKDTNSAIDLSRANSTSTSSDHLWDFTPSDSEIETSITISEHSISQNNNNYIKLFSKLPWNKLPYGLLIIESKKMTNIYLACYYIINILIIIRMIC